MHHPRISATASKDEVEARARIQWARYRKHCREKHGKCHATAKCMIVGRMYARLLNAISDGLFVRN